MGFLDTELTEEQRVMVDQLSPIEYAEMIHQGSGQLPDAMVDHYWETFLWWGSTAFTLQAGWEDSPDPMSIPAPKAMARAASRGSFLVHEQEPAFSYCVSCGGATHRAPLPRCYARGMHPQPREKDWR